MTKTQRRIRLTIATTKNPNTNETELEVRATTKVEGRELTVQGADEETAIRQLHIKVDKFLADQKFKADYPKTVEVEW